MFRMFTNSFNRRSPVSASLQVVNLLAFGAAGYNILTNPEASIAEFGLDMLTHGVSYFALSEAPSLLADTGSTFINALRLGAIYTGMTTVGCSTVPFAAAAADTAVHFSNMVVPLLEKTEAQVAPETHSAKMH